MGTVGFSLQHYGNKEDLQNKPQVEMVSVHVSSKAGGSS